MFGLGSLKLAAIAAAAALLMAGGAYLKGRSDGRELGRVAALEQAVKAYQTREVIDDETSNLDDADLCIALGGLPDECAAVLRGMDPAAENQ